MKTAIQEVLLTILLALLIFVAIRSVVHNYEINGFSMEPSLHDGQFVIVNKAAYWFHNPHRGDIVVFNLPRLNRGIIHRVVGLPGELVEIRKGKLYINGKKIEEPYIQGHSISVSPRKIPANCYFIIGDNRDAASWNIVRKKDIIGKAWICYWPIRDWGLVPNYSWGTKAKEQP